VQGTTRDAEGAWRVIHAHTSVPFRMDGSETAALDLRP
jgi:ketosteroid isomerase-like protein